MGSVGTGGRRVIRNRRIQLLAVLSLLAAVGFAVLAGVVIAAPGHSIDNPGGFTGAGRALTVGGCLLVTAVALVGAVAGFRVALVLDADRLVIRNPWSTTVVPWQSHPHFEVRNRRQDVNVQGPVTTTAAWQQSGTITYRYREIVCVANRRHIWIAATSRMRQQDRVDELLTDLREAAGGAHRDSVSQ